MSIPVNGDIGLEKHPDTDQFIRLDRGRGRAQMGPGKDELTFDREVTDGWCVIVPAGSWHNITNIGDEPMQVYTVYAPQHHKPGKVAPDQGDRRRRHRRRTRRLVVFSRTRSQTSTPDLTRRTRTFASAELRAGTLARSCH